MSESFFAWVSAGVAGIMTTLAGAISFLYGKQLADHKETKDALSRRIASLEEKVDHCESEHSTAREVIARLETRLEIVEKKANA